MRLRYFKTKSACAGVILCLAQCQNVFGADWHFEYLADLVKNTSNGQSRSSAFIDNAVLSVNERKTWQDGWQLDVRMSALYTNGNTFSQDVVGDVQSVSGLETGAAYSRVQEAWFNFGNSTHSLLLGLYDVNSEFDVLESGNLFVNGAYGMGSELALSGEVGPATLPLTALSVRYQRNITKQHLVRVAITDATPGNEDSPNSVAINTSSEDGHFSIAEWQYQNDTSKWLAGYWRYNKLQGDTQSTDHNHGFYVRMEHQFHDIENTTGFVRVGTAPTAHSQFDRFYSAGVVISPSWQGIEHDQFGVALAYLEPSKTTQDSLYSAQAELNLEITYLWQLNQHFALQPNLQYIKNAGGIAQSSSAVLGLRTLVSF